jgi:Ca2+/H+ antiporter
MRLSIKPSMNWFFVFVPVTVLIEHVEGIPVPLIFFSAALAILPIASMIVRATEQIASRVGDTIGGLLNATFGNAPELIITIVALRAGLLEMVRASLAIVGGAAESGSAIAMARKNKVDLSIGIALGSCVQIALFIAPILVFASYVVSPRPFLLAFSRVEILSMFLAILIGVMVAGDGRSHWFKGVQLITLYLVIAMMFYFLPVSH